MGSCSSGARAPEAAEKTVGGRVSGSGGSGSVSEEVEEEPEAASADERPPPLTPQGSGAGTGADGVVVALRLACAAAALSPDAVAAAAAAAAALPPASPVRLSVVEVYDAPSTAPCGPPAAVARVLCRPAGRDAEAAARRVVRNLRARPAEVQLADGFAAVTAAVREPVRRGDWDPLVLCWQPHYDVYTASTADGVAAVRALGYVPLPFSPLGYGRAAAAAVSTRPLWRLRGAGPTLLVTAGSAEGYSRDGPPVLHVYEDEEAADRAAAACPVGLTADAAPRATGLHRYVRGGAADAAAAVLTVQRGVEDERSIFTSAGFALTDAMVVTAVREGSAAAAAGLRAGMLVTAADGVPVAAPAQAEAAVDATDDTFFELAVAAGRPAEDSVLVTADAAPPSIGEYVLAGTEGYLIVSGHTDELMDDGEAQQHPQSSDVTSCPALDKHVLVQGQPVCVRSGDAEGDVAAAVAAALRVDSARVAGLSGAGAAAVAMRYDALSHGGEYRAELLPAEKEVTVRRLCDPRAAASVSVCEGGAAAVVMAEVRRALQLSDFGCDLSLVDGGGRSVAAEFGELQAGGVYDVVEECSLAVVNAQTGRRSRAAVARHHGWATLRRNLLRAAAASDDAAVWSGPPGDPGSRLCSAAADVWVLPSGAVWVDAPAPRVRSGFFVPAAPAPRAADVCACGDSDSTLTSAGSDGSYQSSDGFFSGRCSTMLPPPPPAPPPSTPAPFST